MSFEISKMVVILGIKLHLFVQHDTVIKDKIVHIVKLLNVLFKMEQMLTLKTIKSTSIVVVVSKV